MENLPKDMVPDRDNIMYFDTGSGRPYLIKWEPKEGGGLYPVRFYISFKI